jgi:hypothetical protein
MVAFEIACDGLGPFDGKGAVIPRGVNEHRHVGNERAGRVVGTCVLECEREDLMIGDATTAIYPGYGGVSILRYSGKRGHFSLLSDDLRVGLPSCSAGAHYTSARYAAQDKYLLYCYYIPVFIGVTIYSHGGHLQGGQTRLALQNAASIAGLMLTTEALMADIKEDAKAGAGAGGGGGMGGMY